MEKRDVQGMLAGFSGKIQEEKYYIYIPAHISDIQIIFLISNNLPFIHSLIQIDVDN